MKRKPKQGQGLASAGGPKQGQGLASAGGLSRGKDRLRLVAFTGGEGFATAGGLSRGKNWLWGIGFGWWPLLGQELGQELASAGGLYGGEGFCHGWWPKQRQELALGNRIRLVAYAGARIGARIGFGWWTLRSSRKDDMKNKKSKK